MDIDQAFAILGNIIGTDEACGKFVHLHPKYYEALRNKRVRISPRTAEYIIMKAQELSGPGTCLARESAAVSV